MSDIPKHEYDHSLADPLIEKFLSGLQEVEVQKGDLFEGYVDGLNNDPLAVEDLLPIENKSMAHFVGFVMGQVAIRSRV